VATPWRLRDHRRGLVGAARGANALAVKYATVRGSTRQRSGSYQAVATHDRRRACPDRWVDQSAAQRRVGLSTNFPAAGRWRRHGRPDLLCDAARNRLTRRDQVARRDRQHCWEASRTSTPPVLAAAACGPEVEELSIGLS